MTYILILLCVTAIGASLLTVASEYKKMRQKAGINREEHHLNRALTRFTPPND